MDTTQAETLLYQLFTGDAVLSGLVDNNFVANIAEQGQALPCVHAEYQPTPGDRNALSGTRAWAPLLYAITATGKSNSVAALEPIATRIEELLGGYRVETDECVIRVQRVQAISQPFVAFGATRYAQLGGVYRIAHSPKT